MKNPFVTWITSPEALLLKMVINWGETWSPYLLFSPWNDNNLKRQGWVMVILDSGLILPPTLLSEVTHSHFTANDLLRLHLYNGREEREGAGLHPKSSSARTHYFSQYLASPVSDTKREYHGGGSLLQGGAWPPGAAPRGLVTRWVDTLAPPLGGATVPLVSSGYRPGMLLDVLRCTGMPSASEQRSSGPKYPQCQGWAALRCHHWPRGLQSVRKESEQKWYWPNATASLYTERR